MFLQSLVICFLGARSFRFSHRTCVLFSISYSSVPHLEISQPLHSCFIGVGGFLIPLIYISFITFKVSKTDAKYTSVELH